MFDGYQLGIAQLITVICILTDPQPEREGDIRVQLCCGAAMAEATIRHLASPAFVTGVAIGAGCAALYVRLLHSNTDIFKYSQNPFYKPVICQVL